MKVTLPVNIFMIYSGENITHSSQNGPVDNSSGPGHVADSELALRILCQGRSIVHATPQEQDAQSLELVPQALIYVRRNKIWQINYKQSLMFGRDHQGLIHSNISAAWVLQR
jgi:hypothetical protein